MIGDGWDGDPAVRPGCERDEPRPPRRILVVTGSRAEFGLLRPVMRAIERHPALSLLVVAAGSHLIPPAQTYREVKRDFAVADSIPMQAAGRTTRFDDTQAVGQGLARFGRSFDRLRPDWVVVLGDRIEALAAAVAASIGGFPLAHIHGGDRAEGLADEAIRHAITKMANLHFAATRASAERLVRMGEAHVHAVGSPAIDELAGLAPLSDAAHADLGAPLAVFLMHPIGRSDEQEEHAAGEVLAGLREGLEGPILALYPNHDPGRAGILRAIESAGVRNVSHLPREAFVSLLARLARQAGVLAGNSSAGLIEAAALRCPAIDVGSRQAGRERVGNVVHTDRENRSDVREAVAQARRLDLSSLDHPYGDGHAGQRIAEILAHAVPTIRKRNTY